MTPHPFIYLVWWSQGFVRGRLLTSYICTYRSLFVVLPTYVCLVVVKDMSGRISVLQIFGHIGKNIEDFNRYGSADNAGDDAEINDFGHRTSDLCLHFSII